MTALATCGPPPADDWRVRVRSSSAVWVSVALTEVAAQRLRERIRLQIGAVRDGSGLLEPFAIREDGSSVDIRARCVEAVEVLGPKAGPARRTGGSPRAVERQAGTTPPASPALLAAQASRRLAAPPVPQQSGRRWL